MVVEISPEKYMDKLVEYAMVKIYAMANVTETRQAWSEEDDFVISKPKLTVQVNISVQIISDITSVLTSMSVM